MPSQDGGGAPPDVDKAIREYEFSRDRYIHSIRADAEAKLMASVSKRRSKLAEEVENLRKLAISRNEQRQSAVRAYAGVCPNRVSASSFLPPSTTDRLGNLSADRLFRAAVKAVDDLNEVNDLLRKKRDALDLIDQDIRDAMQRQTDEIIRRIETPEGLANAFARDPLLGAAHARMKAALAQREAYNRQVQEAQGATAS